jgi:hypothetical protein
MQSIQTALSDSQESPTNGVDEEAGEVLWRGAALLGVHVGPKKKDMRLRNSLW